jgi:hypothetical protein
MTVPKKSRKFPDGNRATKDRAASKPARKSRRSATKDGAERAARPGSKQASLIALLQRTEGATIAQMSAKTGWQAHSVRSALTGLRKRGIAVTRTKDESGASVYRAGPA